MIRKMYVAITKGGSGGLGPPDVGMVTQISAPPHPLLKSTSNATADETSYSQDIRGYPLLPFRLT